MDQAFASARAVCRGDLRPSWRLSGPDACLLADGCRVSLRQGIAWVSGAAQLGAGLGRMGRLPVLQVRHSHHRLTKGQAAIIRRGLTVQQNRHALQPFEGLPQQNGVLKTPPGQGDSPGLALLDQRSGGSGETLRDCGVKQGGCPLPVARPRQIAQRGEQGSGVKHYA